MAGLLRRLVMSSSIEEEGLMSHAGCRFLAPLSCALFIMTTIGSTAATPPEPSLAARGAAATDRSAALLAQMVDAQGRIEQYRFERSIATSQPAAAAGELEGAVPEQAVADKVVDQLRLAAALNRVWVAASAMTICRPSSIAS